MHFRKPLYALLGLVLLLAACSTATRLSAGELLDAVGQAFLDATQRWDEAYALGLVSDQAYQDFAEWAKGFQQAFLRAYQLWQVGDDPEAVARLLEELRREVVLWVLRLDQETKR
jgi:thioredoxin-like negative regulator of GroEL